MEGKKILTFLVVVLILAMLALYWYFPSDPKEFRFNGENNFSLNNESQMQFYPNMRFPVSNLSYSIDDKCSLSKRNDMIKGFEYIDNLTLIDFYESDGNVNVLITCDDKVKIENGMFIAGEGGPVNATIGKKFSVITQGHILLLRDSNCERPNIAIHELLHVLGFDHSDNPNNIMYPVSKCKQVISEDMLLKINELYAIPSLPDIAFENVNATIIGRFMNVEIILQNEGLASSGDFIIGIYANDKRIDEVEVSNIEIGGGKIITATNILVPQIKVNQLVFSIEEIGPELDEKNNEVILNINN